MLATLMLIVFSQGWAQDQKPDFRRGISLGTNPGNSPFLPLIIYKRAGQNSIFRSSLHFSRLNTHQIVPIPYNHVYTKLHEQALLTWEVGPGIGLEKRKSIGKIVEIYYGAELRLSIAKSKIEDLKEGLECGGMYVDESYQVFQTTGTAYLYPFAGIRLMPLPRLSISLEAGARLGGSRTWNKSISKTTTKQPTLISQNILEGFNAQNSYFFNILKTPFISVGYLF